VPNTEWWGLPQHSNGFAGGKGGLTGLLVVGLTRRVWGELGRRQKLRKDKTRDIVKPIKKE